jgi:hypothetical protein
MTDLVERAGTESADTAPGSSAPARRGGVRRLVQGPRAIVMLICVVLVAAACSTVGVAAPSPTGHPARSVTTVSLVSTTYTPQATTGTTDDYHCTLVDPHVTRDSYVISSQFHPGNGEDHHAVLALVPPSLAATAKSADPGHQGWTCFGAPTLPGGSLGDIFRTPFLSVWAPGHGADALPRGTGIALPAGSLVIEQVHYNLLVGDQPVQDSLVLDTVPMSTPLLPLNLHLGLAPPDLPCPSGVTSPLCDRTASLADQARRFGPDASIIANGIELLCGHANPIIGETASCTSTIEKSGYIVRTQAHMHLLGRAFTMILNPGTPQASTVLNVPSYNFDYQKAYNLDTPIPVRAGDRIQVNCTYDPRLAQELPILRKAPTHFVTWGDGSSDEMCIGLAWTTTALPDSRAAL